MVFLGAMDAFSGSDDVPPRGFLPTERKLRPAEELTNLASGLCCQSALGYRASWMFRRDKLGQTWTAQQLECSQWKIPWKVDDLIPSGEHFAMERSTML